MASRSTPSGSQQASKSLGQALSVTKLPLGHSVTQPAEANDACPAKPFQKAAAVRCGSEPRRGLVPGSRVLAGRQLAVNELRDHALGLLRLPHSAWRAFVVSELDSRPRSRASATTVRRAAAGHAQDTRDTKKTQNGGHQG